MKKIHILDWVALGIILFGVILRLLRLDIPFDPEDVHLDYLAAHHIALYGEIPWSGSGNPILIDSPLYYYIVSVFVRMYDNLLFLGVVNIVAIQAVTFGIVYLLAKLLFDRWVGILAIFLAAISFEYTVEGAYFFQTHVMQVFANGAFLALLVAYKKRSTWFAAASVVFLATSLTIHHSVLALLPLYAVVLFLSIPKTKNRWKTFGMLAGVGVGTLFLFHVPIFLLLGENSPVVDRVIDAVSGGHVASLVEFLGKFSRNIAQFIYAFSLRWTDNSTLVNRVAAVFLGVSFLRFMMSAGKGIRRVMWGIVGAILSLVIASSLLRTGVWNFTFTSVSGLFLIAISVLITYWFDGPLWRKGIGVGILILTLYAFSNGFFLLRREEYPPLYRAQITRASTQEIATTVRHIQTAESRPDVSFFRIRRVHKRPEGGFDVDVYSAADIQVIEDLLYWPELENLFATRFVRMERDGTFPTILNRDDYVFVICDSTRNRFTGSEDCLRRYLGDYPMYDFVAHIYASPPITIELVRRRK